MLVSVSYHSLKWTLDDDKKFFQIKDEKINMIIHTPQAPLVCSLMDKLAQASSPLSHWSIARLQPSLWCPVSCLFIMTCVDGSAKLESILLLLFFDYSLFQCGRKWGSYVGWLTACTIFPISSSLKCNTFILSHFTCRGISFIIELFCISFNHE